MKCRRACSGARQEHADVRDGFKKIRQSILVYQWHKRLRAYTIIAVEYRHVTGAFNVIHG